MVSVMLTVERTRPFFNTITPQPEVRTTFLTGPASCLKSQVDRESETTWHKVTENQMFEKENQERNYKKISFVLLEPGSV